MSGGRNWKASKIAGHNYFLAQQFKFVYSKDETQKLWKNLDVHKDMFHFEAFHQVISLSINLSFLESDGY